MPDLLYEHPLNERIRNYLKIEQLFVQARSCLAHDFGTSHVLFFNALFAILDTIDRTDVKGEIIKDLERLEQNLLLWSNAPDINSRALQLNLEQCKRLTATLRSKNCQWAELNDDKFLYSMRKRFSLQNAYCCFDLPALAFWLNQPPILIQQDIENWLGSLSVIEQSLTQVLKFIRQRASFEAIDAVNGFYQENGEGISLLRMRLDKGMDYFPIVSGNKHRYSIRFMELCPEKGQQYISERINFKLAKC